MNPKQLVKGALLAGARAAGRRWAGAPGAMVLMYHSVGRAGVPYTVADEVFRAQMRYLLESGRPLLTVEQLAQAHEERSVPPGAVCITFDDAFDSAAEPLRWLLKQGGQATLFVVAAEPGYNHWDQDDPAIPRLRRMSWDRIRSLIEAGVALGSHTVNHCRLTEQDQAGLRYELFDARRILVETLQAPVPAVAYPYGLYDERVVRAAQAAGYSCGCTTQYSYVEGRLDPMLLPRFEPETLAELQDLAEGRSHLFYRATGLVHRAHNWQLLRRA